MWQEINSEAVLSSLNWDIDSDHTWYIYPQRPAKIWWSPDKPGLLDEVLCGADLTGLVSARFIFPLSTGVWSALSSAWTPWCSRQSIKSISVSCSLGDSGWQPEWACSSPISSSPSSCHCLLSLCNMSGLIEACQCSLAAQSSLLR